MDLYLCRFEGWCRRGKEGWENICSIHADQAGEAQMRMKGGSTILPFPYSKPKLIVLITPVWLKTAKCNLAALCKDLYLQLFKGSCGLKEMGMETLKLIQRCWNRGFIKASLHEIVTGYFHSHESVCCGNQHKALQYPVISRCSQCEIRRKREKFYSLPVKELTKSLELKLKHSLGSITI